MAMVGLFWITEDCVYVGSEPVGMATGVRLTEHGVEIPGLRPEKAWSWNEVRLLEVRDVAVRSAARRFVSMAFDTLLVAVTGDGELPPAYTVRVETAAGDETEVSVLSAVTGGIYTREEYDNSLALLERLTDGRTNIADLLAWRRDHGMDDTPPREEREALLRKWTGV
ncbi:hypothetical protein [Streptomyces sp. NPDC086787]|uniref:hypothetical protein n=1 Tax=Streptomyces sp. NPDC086787 TaxID=3365759 RepID=UPI00382EF25E